MYVRIVVTTIRPAQVRSWLDDLRHLDRGIEDEDRIDLIRALEELTCGAAAAQAVLAADLDDSQRAEQAARGVPVAQQGRGVASAGCPGSAGVTASWAAAPGLAKILRAELPETFAAFRAGRITEWKAMLVARETACLRLEDRAIVDAEMAGNPERIEAMGDGELVAEARKLACRLDPASVAERRAAGPRQHSPLLPVKAGVAVYAVLTREADRRRAEGDTRSRGQLMADVLVDRVTGLPESTSGQPGVMVSVVVSDDVLWGDSDDAGHVDGYGPVPADLARDLALSDSDGLGARWFRRVYACPASGSLVAMDSRARSMPPPIAQVLRIRDRICRTPWCDAPIRHSDHVRAVDEDGETSERNGQGLCEACNHAKQAPGWRARPGPGIRHTVETTTPTGHTYRSTAPPTGKSVFQECEPGRWVRVA